MVFHSGKSQLRWLKGAITALALSVISLEAMAQAGSALCRRLEGQLQNSGGDPRAAARQQNELNKTIAYANSLGCNNFFKPGECYPLFERINAMRANVVQLSQGGNRAAILAALQQNGCRGNVAVRAPDVTRGPQAAYRVEEPPPQPRGFFDALFGRPAPPQETMQPIEQQPKIIDEEPRRRYGGSRLVCVKACDGSFFPLNSFSGFSDPDDLSDLCNLQCPGAEAQIYRMPGEGDIADAVSFDGEPYMRLPNALAFRKRFDKSCSCRPPHNALWQEALQNRDDVTVKSGDQIVSAEQARIMSLPPAQRSIAQEKMRQDAAARREAERLARAERKKSKQNNAAVGLDGQLRPTQINEMPLTADPLETVDEPPAIRGPVRVIPAPHAMPKT